MSFHKWSRYNDKFCVIFFQARVNLVPSDVTTLSDIKTEITSLKSLLLGRYEPKCEMINTSIPLEIFFEMGQKTIVM